jgi:hypothetical protein
LYTLSNAAAAHIKLQQCLDSISVWCTQWCMQLNESKCSAMCFGNNNLAFIYSMNGQNIATMPSVRDLGVTITDNSTVSSQCQQVAATARRLTGLMIRTFK